MKLKKSIKSIKSKRPIGRKVSKLTFGLLHSLGDLILLWLHFAEEFDPLTPHSFATPPMKKLDVLLEGYGSDKLYNNFYQLREKGWLDPDWKLTKEGWKKLKGALPECKKPSQWNGEWYIVTFDIPESCRRKRDALREKLEKLGFGRLQNSVWISPVNYLANIESWVKFHNIENWVIPSATNKLGRVASEELAERVWHIERINERYKDFISLCKKFFRKEKGYKFDKFRIIMNYLRILKEDPQLPENLLSADWQAKLAHKFYQKLLGSKTRKKDKDN